MFSQKLKFERLKNLWIFQSIVINEYAFLLLWVALFLQCGFFFYLISMNVDILPVIDSESWDAGRGIEAAMRSSWWSNNGWHYYGNLYYRISHSLTVIGQEFLSNNKPFEIEALERLFHFSCMTVSGLSLLAISWMMASIFSNGLNRLTLFFFLNLAFWNGDAWSRWVLNVHPDMLLSALTGFGIVVLVNFLDKKDGRLLLFLGVVWGFALATKLSTLVALPAVCVALFLSQDGFKRLGVPTAFCVLVLITYLFIGFPQNNDVISTIKAMSNVSHMNRPPSIRSVNQTINEISSQTKVIIVPLLLSIMLSSYSRVSPPRMNAVLYGALACAIYLLYFLSTDSIIRMEHYFLPPSVMLLVVLCFSFRRVSWIVQERLMRYRFQKTVSLCLASFLILWTLYSDRNHPLVNLNSIRESRELSQNMLSSISKAADLGYRVYVDPYVPFRMQFGNVTYSDSPTARSIDLRSLDILVFSTRYSARFTADSGTIEWEKKRPNWEQIRDFYLLFKGKEVFVDDFNQTWVKMTDRYKERWSVWKRKEIIDWY